MSSENPFYKEGAGIILNPSAQEKSSERLSLELENMPDNMPKSLPESLALKPERPDFEAIKERKLENARNRIVSFKESIKNKFSAIVGKAKGIGKETLGTIMASPEIVKYGKDIASYEVRQAYEKVADKTKDAIEKTEGWVDEKYDSVVEGAKNTYNNLENRAVDAYFAFNDRVESVKSRIKEKIEARRKEKLMDEYFVIGTRMNRLIKKHQKLAIALGERPIRLMWGQEN